MSSFPDGTTVPPHDYGEEDLHLAPPPHTMPRKLMTHRRPDGSVISTSRKEVWDEAMDAWEQNKRGNPAPILMERKGIPEEEGEYIQEEPTFFDPREPDEVRRDDDRRRASTEKDDPETTSIPAHKYSEEEILELIRKSPETQVLKSTPAKVVIVRSTRKSEETPQDSSLHEVRVIRHASGHGPTTRQQLPSRPAATTRAPQNEHHPTAPPFSKSAPPQRAGSPARENRHPKSAFAPKHSPAAMPPSVPTVTSQQAHPTSASVEPTEGTSSCNLQSLLTAHGKIALPPTFKELSLMIRLLFENQNFLSQHSISMDDLLVQREILYLKEANMPELTSQHKIHLLLNAAHAEELNHVLESTRGNGVDADQAMVNLREHLRDLFGKHRVHAMKVDNHRYMYIIGENLHFFELKYHTPQQAHLKMGARLVLPSWDMTKFDPSQFLGQQIGVGIDPLSREFPLLDHQSLCRFVEGELIRVFPIVDERKNIPPQVDRDLLFHAVHKHPNSLYYTFGKHKRSSIAIDANAEGYFVILYYSHDNPSRHKQLVECSPPYRLSKMNMERVTVQLVTPKIEGKRLWTMQVLFFQDSGEVKCSMVYPVFSTMDFVNLVLSSYRQ